jgi:hypothetical protein
MRFSERHGYRPIRAALQAESADIELRNSIWSLLYDEIFWPMDANDWNNYSYNPQYAGMAKLFWVHLYKQPLDIFPPKAHSFIQFVRARLLEGPWYELYDLIQFYLEHDHSQPQLDGTTFQQRCNFILEREMSAWRVVGEEVARLTSEEEIAAVEAVEQLDGPFAGVSQHMRNAVRLLSDRHSPDYPNSMKEAISAVEGACQVITGEPRATLGAALRKLEGKGVLMHPAAQAALGNLYGYTNDADGIRHAEIDSSTVDFEDAKFMLVACSAFVNLLIARYKDASG